MKLKRIKEEINRLEAYKADESITDNGLELLAELKYTNNLVKNNAVLPLVSNSFDDEIDEELERRSIVQYMDDEDDEPHWDEGKLYWARKMFREGAKWANER